MGLLKRQSQRRRTDQLRRAAICAETATSLIPFKFLSSKRPG